MKSVIKIIFNFTSLHLFIKKKRKFLHLIINSGLNEKFTSILFFFVKKIINHILMKNINIKIIFIISYY
jgi:hypothetical protein